MYEPAFCNWMRKSSHSGWSQATAEKFSQSVTAATFHVTMSIFAWRVLRDKDWLWDVEQWSDNTHLDNQAIEPDFKLYYLLYAARYTSDLVSLFFEHSRSVRKNGMRLETTILIVQSISYYQLLLTTFYSSIYFEVAGYLCVRHAPCCFHWISVALRACWLHPNRRCRHVLF